MSFSPKESQKVQDLLFKEVVRTINQRDTTSPEGLIKSIDTVKAQLDFLLSISRNGKMYKKKVSKQSSSKRDSSPSTPASASHSNKKRRLISLPEKHEIKTE